MVDYLNNVGKYKKEIKMEIKTVDGKTLGGQLYAQCQIRNNIIAFDSSTHNNKTHTYTEWCIEKWLICLFLTSKTPGPGTYNVISPDKYRTKQPKYSLKGRKFMPGDGTIRPGPGIYYPEKVRHNFEFCIS